MRRNGTDQAADDIATGTSGGALGAVPDPGPSSGGGALDPVNVPTASFGPAGGPQLKYFGPAPDTGNWISQDNWPRLLGDINDDGKADIVGFADNGVVTALANSNGNGGFGTQQFQLGTALWGFTSGGWNEPGVARQLADVNGDGFVDLVGFGVNKVVVSLNNKIGTNGTFGAQAAQPDPVVNSFWSAQGGWDQDQFPRFLADVLGGGTPDIVGFSESGVVVSLNNGTGTFYEPELAPGTEWWGDGPGTGNWVGNQNQPAQDLHPRFLADVNGDGMDDLVGFGDAGIEVSLATGNGNFATHTAVPGTLFWSVQGGWSSQNLFPRFLADINGDGKADIVGFNQPQNPGDTGVWASLNTSTAGNVSFAAPVQVASSFWTPAQGFTNNDLYTRALADITGDHKADIVGFLQSGVWTSISTSTVSVPSGGGLGPVSGLDSGPSATSSPAVTNTGNDGGNVIVGSPFSNNEEITGAGTMEFTGAVASGHMVTFDPSSTGTLKLDNSPGFAGTVAGLALGNHIDLTDIQFSSVHAPTYTPNAGNSGGMLTVTDGQHTANIALLGQYMAGSFATSSDGHGGTLITDTPLTTQPVSLTPPHLLPTNS